MKNNLSAWPLLTCIMLASFLFVSNCFASDATKILQQKLTAIKTFKAKFTQTLRNDKKIIIQQSQGSVILMRPNHFYWKVSAPNPQALIADGKNLWIYDVNLEQVTIKPLAQAIADTPAAILTDSHYLIGKQFTVFMKIKGTQQIYNCHPKKQNVAFKKIELVFSGKKLIKMQLQDKLDQFTEINFTQINMNHKLPKKLFTFTPPPGVDVIGKPSTK